MGNIATRFLLSLLAACTAWVSASAAALVVTPTNVTSSVNLSVEGTADWAHWGLDSAASFNRRSNGFSRIANVSLLGTAPVMAVTNTALAFSWTNGTPVSNTNTTNQLLITGADSGFDVLVSADTTTRRLKLFLGLEAVT